MLGTETNILFVMSLLILVQILLVGLRVTGNTTDTRRQCTGILILMSAYFIRLGYSCNNKKKTVQNSSFVCSAAFT